MSTRISEQGELIAGTLPDLFPKHRTILERSMMEFRPFGLDEL